MLARGVLGLVDDDEAVVQRAAAHEREGRDLDLPLFEVARDLLGAQHVVQRVEERAQVRIDLGHEVTREESEALTGLDGRAREEDALHPALGQGGGGHGDRQERLAGAGRADPERDRVLADRLDVCALAGRLRCHAHRPPFQTTSSWSAATGSRRATPPAIRSIDSASGGAPRSLRATISEITAAARGHRLLLPFEDHVVAAQRDVRVEMRSSSRSVESLAPARAVAASLLRSSSLRWMLLAATRSA